MTSIDRDIFVRDNKGKKLKKSNWSPNAYFIPNGRICTHVLNKEEMMSGTYIKGNQVIENVTYNIEEGLHANKLGISWQHYKHVLTLIKK